MQQVIVASQVPARESTNEARYRWEANRDIARVYPSEGARSETVEWALNVVPATIQDARVDHRCPDVLVAE